jgi:hypothetical protein
VVDIDLVDEPLLAGHRGPEVFLAQVLPVPAQRAGGLALHDAEQPHVLLGRVRPVQDRDGGLQREPAVAAVEHEQRAPGIAAQPPRPGRPSVPLLHSFRRPGATPLRTALGVPSGAIVIIAAWWLPARRSW